MENKKYTKGTKIRKFKLSGSGRWTNYSSALDEIEIELLKFAAMCGYVTSGNDAPHGGKYGDYYLILKYFTTNSMSKRLKSYISKRDSALKKVLNSTKVRSFITVSDIGCFKIDGALYSNFYGDGTNQVDVCECDEREFQSSELLSRRQVYNSKDPISIVKYDTPRTVKVSTCDCDDSWAVESIDNVLGFCIWQCKLKIFIKK